MKRTRICELLGIEYPIIAGGMVWISNAELAAAVSEAGALGIISAWARWDGQEDLGDNLRRQIRLARELTNKPFGVNITVAHPSAKSLVDAAIEEQVPVVTTSAGNPATFTSLFKDRGIRVMHVIASRRHALGAEKAGVDAVIAEGYEAGGHNGPDELTTFTLVPQVVDAVKLSVVAAGGIADARGFVAALALGAEGVQMGTRFVATTQSAAHPAVKQAIVEAGDTSTVITGHGFGPTRGLKNAFTAEMLKLERSGATVEQLLAFIGADRSRAGHVNGDLEQGEMYCGSIAGLITDIMDAGEVVRSIVEGVDAVLARLR